MREGMFGGSLWEQTWDCLFCSLSSRLAPMPWPCLCQWNSQISHLALNCAVSLFNANIRAFNSNMESPEFSEFSSAAHACIHILFSSLSITDASIPLVHSQFTALSASSPDAYGRARQTQEELWVALTLSFLFLPHYHFWHKWLMSTGMWCGVRKDMKMWFLGSLCFLG